MRRPQKPVPPPETHAETFYYAHHREQRTPMVVVLVSGDMLRGVIKWYDRGAIKLVRPDAAEIMLPKRQIKYLYEE
jgi:sRNA-binding regulator protein Hfq